MKKIVSLFLTVFLAAGMAVVAPIAAAALPEGAITYADGIVPAKDPNIRYIGRWVTEEDDSRTGYFESSVELGFTGKNISIDLGECNGTIVYNIDGGANKLKTYHSATTIALATGLEEGEHFLQIHGNFQGACPRIKAFKLDEGAASLPLKDRPTIEFIGDSISVGYVDTGFGANINSVSTTFGYKVAQKLGFSCNTVAHGGIAMVPGNGNPDKIAMYNRYFKTGEYSTNRDDVDWDTSTYVPDYIVLTIGYNDNYTKEDNNAKFQEYYTLFLERLRKAYADTPIFCLTEFVDKNVPAITAAVDARHAAGDSKVILVDSSSWVPTEQLNPNDGVHLLAKGHTTVAEKLLPIIEDYIKNGASAPTAAAQEGKATDTPGQLSVTQSAEDKNEASSFDWMNVLYICLGVAAGAAVLVVLTVVTKKKKK